MFYWNQQVFKKTLDYIHNNIVITGLCQFQEEYCFFCLILRTGEE